MSTHKRVSLEAAEAISDLIEAAEALVANREMLEGFRFPFAFHKLIHAQREAVEALQAVEGGSDEHV